MNRFFKKTIFLLAAVTLTAGVLTLLFKGPTPRVQAATCPFIDNDANDADATVGVYQLNVDFNVPAAATAYDCTSASGITTFIVPAAKTMTLQSNTATGEIAQMSFTNLQIDSTGKISADAKGCVNTGNGPGYGPNGSNVCTISTAGAGAGDGGNNGGAGGAGHGGAGGAGNSYAGGATYGSATAPTLFGSSGGGVFSAQGGTGGGVVQLSVSGTFTHNGVITANGVNGVVGNQTFRLSGGGSGGSINVTAGTIDGTGTFSSTGGAGATGVGNGGGGGGGGRVSVVYASGGFGFSSAAFIVTGGASGGSGSVSGTKGTVYTRKTSTDAVTIYHGFTYTDTDYSAAVWTTDPSATNQYCDLTIPSNATPSVTASGALTFGGTLSCTQTITSFSLSAGTAFSSSSSASMTINGAITLAGGTSFTLGSGSVITDSKQGTSIIFTIPAGNAQTWTDVTINGPVQGMLTIGSASAITLAGTTAVNSSIQWPNVTDLTIGSSAVISANAKGCVNTGNGPGYGPNGSNVCTISTAGAGAGDGGNNGGAGGAGHGGAGGAGNSYAGGATYGSATAPTLFGSSGGGVFSAQGGTGGGVVQLSVSGTFTHNGVITANGVNGVVGNQTFRLSGGGSGGSINVTAGTIDGTGTFSSTGGAGATGVGNGGGGGGGGRVSVVYASGGFGFSSAAFIVTGGASGGSGSVSGTKGTVYTRKTSTDAVTIYHGFTYTDTDYSAAVWTTDPSATNQYCDLTIPSNATPSVTASGALTFGGTLSCTQTITSFNWSSGTAFTISTGAVMTITATGSTVDLNIPAGTTTTWNDFSFTGGIQGMLTVNDAASIILSGTSVMTANVRWTNLVDLTLGASASINANAKGCVNTGSGAGYGPNGSNVCTISTAGAGAGDVGQNGGAGGAGHGGAGGAGNSFAGGATYDSALAPTLFGSSGGGVFTAQGGTGAGVVQLSVSGTFTHDGVITANGANGVVGNATFRVSGGGSGGSIYVTTSSYACSTGSFQAKGGAGGVGSGNGGGGGGGGRLSVDYVSDSSGGCPLSGLTASTVVSGGASGGSGSAAGSTGTLNLTQTNFPPVNGSVAINPTNPEVGQNVVVSASATDGAGIASIKIYLDGTAPGNLVKTCLFSPVQTPASCQHGLGSLTAGAHSVTVVSEDGGALTDSDTVNFTVSGQTGANTVDLSTYKKSAASVFSLSFTLSATSTGSLVVTFPSQFSVNSAATSGSGCLSGFTFNGGAKTLTATKTACTGTVTMTGATLTNPSLAGQYTITWTNDNGSGIVTIVDDDNFSITASVDPIITFNIGTQASATACDGSFTGNGGTLPLGTLSTAAVGSSDLSSVPHICTRLSTNAPGGAVVTVRSQNASLASVGTPAHTIPSSTATLAAGTAGYGLCAGDGGLATGRDSTAPVGAAPVRTAPFASSCSTSGHAVGALTTSAQTVWSVSDPTQNAFAWLFIKAAISGATLPHDDYADVLTFIATATY